MKLILVGGFLGAGKTTLLWESAKRLGECGKTVGLITNDQAPDLVDTALLSSSCASVREVSGSCFCCNFEGFQEAVQSLVNSGADYIIAEPVGSCTDLSATIIQPLKGLYPSYDVAPLSVLVDPARIRDVLLEKSPLLHADAAYILHLQLEEADQILLNKVDRLSQNERMEILSFLKEEFPQPTIASVSAKTGEGVDAWIQEVLCQKQSGSRIALVDYDRYANGEAVLGWLNSVIALQWHDHGPPDWTGYLRQFLETLRAHLRTTKSEIGHIKALLECATGRAAVNLTGLEEAIYIQSDENLSDSKANLTVNARVQTSPQGIENVFRESLNAVYDSSVTPVIRAFYCIKPGRPQPTYRYDAVLSQSTNDGCV